MPGRELAGKAKTVRRDVFSGLRMAATQAVMTIAQVRQVVAMHQPDGKGHRNVRTEQKDAKAFVDAAGHSYSQ